LPRIRLSEVEFGAPIRSALRPLAAMRSEAADLRETILKRAWNEDAKTLSEHLDGDDSADASLLALPLRGVIPADHPRMVTTTAAVVDRLSAGGGLLYRYLHDESPDGLAGEEGAFLLCSFWLVDNLVHQGGWTRPRNCTRRCAPGRARSGCCRSRSTRRAASSAETSRRRSATSE